MKPWIGAALIGCWLATAAAADTLHVTVDQAKVANLPAGVASLVIGDPAIADVTLLKATTKMVVTGRGYGETNMMALDSAGHVIEERRIYVDPPLHVLVVQRGTARESYSCDPVCMPTAVLGDDTKHFSDVSGQIGAHDQLGKSKSDGAVAGSSGMGGSGMGGAGSPLAPPSGEGSGPPPS